MEVGTLGERLSEETAAILAEIPGRLDIRAVALDAHRRLAKAAAGGSAVAATLAPEVEQAVAEKVAEVLHEVAAHAVDEFERRTGGSFLWFGEDDVLSPEEILALGSDPTADPSLPPTDLSP